MDKGGCEQSHPDRDMHHVPDGHHAPGIGDGGRLGGAQGRIELNPFRGARDTGVDVTPDKTADDHDGGHQGHGPRQAVELPGSVQKNHEGSHQPGENVELEPLRHPAPAHRARTFAQAVERLGHEHQ